MANKSQLEVIAEFMTIIDTVKHLMHDQHYLFLCDQAQIAHNLIEFQPANNMSIEIDDVIVSSRTWRQLKRSVVSDIAVLVHKNRTIRKGRRCS